MDSRQACDPREADVAHGAFLSKEPLQPWHSSGAPFPLQAWASWQVYSVSNITEITGGSDLTVKACSPWGSLVTPTAREAGEPDDSGGAGQPGESR